MELGLCKLQEELSLSKQEILEMRAEVEAKDELWWQEKQRLEQEKLELIQVSGRVLSTPSSPLNQSHSEAPSMTPPTVRLPQCGYHSEAILPSHSRLKNVSCIALLFISWLTFSPY